MKALAIIGLCVAVLSLLCAMIYTNTDPMAAIGWGEINLFFSVAVYIVVLAKKI